MSNLRVIGALAAAAAAVAVAVPATAALGRPAPRGSSCASPWQVSYSRGKVVGDTSKISLQVSTAGQKISIAWHAQKGYTFCAVVLHEARGQVFTSVNPQASYTYTDFTTNHSNGIKTLTATARSGAARPGH